MKKRVKGIQKKHFVFFGVLALFFIFVGTCLFLLRKNAYTQTEVDMTSRGVHSSFDHIKSSSSSPYTLVEYGDFNCVWCYTLHRAEEDLSIDFSNINYIVRLFPKIIPEDSAQKALIAECVYNQSGDVGFFKFSNLLYSPSWKEGLPNDIVMSYGEQSVNDTALLHLCVNTDDKVKRKVAQGFSYAVSGEVTVIPQVDVYKNDILVKTYTYLSPKGFKAIVDYYSKNP